MRCFSGCHQLQQLLPDRPVCLLLTHALLTRSVRRAVDRDVQQGNSAKAAETSSAAPVFERFDTGVIQAAYHRHCHTHHCYTHHCHHYCHTTYYHYYTTAPAMLT